MLVNTTLLIPNNNNNNSVDSILNNATTYKEKKIVGKFYNKKIKITKNDITTYKTVKTFVINKNLNRSIINLISINCLIDNKYRITNISKYNLNFILDLEEL